jgi:large repetitive protein
VQTIGIQRTVATQDGMVYELSFDYAGRPGFGTDFTRIGIYVDGVLQQQVSSTSPQGFIDWKNLKLRLEGDGAEHTITIRTDATAFNAAGRGAFIDDIRLTATQGVVAGNVGGGVTRVALAGYVSTSLVDGDGSESLTLSFTGVPAGASIITAANPGGYSASSDGSITIAASELASAQLQLPDTYNGHLSLGVTAQATEGANGASATATATLELDVLGRLVTSDLTGDGLTNLVGSPNAETLNGGSANEYLVGRGGNDALNGGGGSDVLDGGDGNDTLNGGSGNDVLWGGAGNDRMTGGTGADVFAWTLSDRGAPGTPAVDRITDFDLSSTGDRLNLRDLLVGEHSTGGTGNLASYLDFDTASTPGSTVIRISTTGGFSGGSYAAGAEDQRIVLEGLDVRSALGLGAGASDDQILQELLNRNKIDIGP